ncbi:Molybdopterin molybdochelatase [Candidatus Promineifilum breve]|uniref:Molybdopterin molybdenumtransferase n=1 Tax=Candidatus Promineifilum breve TaxID=1806508 RepID=A0A170PDS1_9CHLR|nr:gephyrin-like molybdotransferase Glp [Candidatus Promineifilum breve]CUS02173.2 Molybdopterin molybdochelatase [Candidatus Promineifilum breve]
MAEFFNVLPPDDARELLLRHIRPIDEIERVATADALGRVTAEALFAPHALPTFRRSTMDGYALRAADSHGATDSLPALLRVVGEVAMGRAADVPFRQPGQAVIVHTGGMLPDWADAVAPVEHTQIVATVAEPGENEIELYRACAAGQNVIQIGEDVAQNGEVLPQGTPLRPQDIGGLLAFGITAIAVTRRPRIAILATGDEVVPPEATPEPGQIRDINSYTIGGLCRRAGGLPQSWGIIADDLPALLAATGAALAQSDMLVITAGSSVSARDMTVQAIAALGRPGVLLHGVATRPGKPTILGAIDGKPVLGLPGNPVSAMVQFDMLGVPAIYRLQGATSRPPRSRIWATLTQNVPSESGREDYVPARLTETAAGYTTTPVFGKSNLIFTLVQTDGLIKVPLNKGGLLAGETVEVILF